MRAAMLLFLLMGCAGIQPSVPLYCGAAGELRVFVEPDNAVTDCPRALAVTREAVADVARRAGPISTPWDVVYRWQFISVDGALAQTDAVEHLIRVREREPENVLHELLHARLAETGEHRTEDHRTMCERWRDCRGT